MCSYQTSQSSIWPSMRPSVYLSNPPVWYSSTEKALWIRRDGIEENQAVRLHKISQLPSNTSFILTHGLWYIYARSLILTSECARPFLAVEFGFSLDGSTVSSCSLLPSQHCFSYLVCSSITRRLMLLYFSVFTLMGTCGREFYCRPFLGGNNCI
jgi:hypothetical protein